MGKRARLIVVLGTVLVAAIAIPSLIAYSAYDADYNAVESIIVQVFLRYQNSSTQPSPQDIFIVTVDMWTPKPALEETRILRTNFSLNIDSIPAGTVTVPFEMRVGGFENRDIAYDARFSLNGTNAQAVLNQNPNHLVLTVRFLAAGIFYRQQIARSLTTTVCRSPLKCHS